MTSYAAQLDNVTEKWSDWRVATLLANSIVEIERVPYCFVINHDVRKGEACPVKYDFTYKGMVGIETEDKETAQIWLETVLALGYRANHAGPEMRRRSGCRPRQPYGDTYSVESVRRRADHKRRPPDDDDDIPF